MLSADNVLQPPTVSYGACMTRRMQGLREMGAKIQGRHPKIGGMIQNADVSVSK